MRSSATMSPTVAEIRRTAEARLHELEPLLAEAEQLRTLLAALDAPASQRRPAPPSGGDRPGASHLSPVPDSRRRVARRRSGVVRGRDGRAPQGSNKRTILDAIAERPGIAAPEVAALTGLKRTVVASTISRLKRTGELEADGAGVRLPAAVSAA